MYDISIYIYIYDIYVYMCIYIHTCLYIYPRGSKYQYDDYSGFCMGIIIVVWPSIPCLRSWTPWGTEREREVYTYIYTYIERERESMYIYIYMYFVRVVHVL